MFKQTILALAAFGLPGGAAAVRTMIGGGRGRTAGRLDSVWRTRRAGNPTLAA
jgi:hypothetical protein